MLTRLLTACICLAVIMGCAKSPQVVQDRLRVGDDGPSFRLSDMFGQEEFRFGKVIHNSNATVIVIWSMACPNCREALTEMQGVYEEYGSKGIPFVGINFDKENTQGVRAFLKAEGIDFTALWDSAGRAARAYKAYDYTFSVFVLNREGKVILAQYDHPPDLSVMLSQKLDEVLEFKPE